jgi:hypothetical protein
VTKRIKALGSQRRIKDAIKELAGLSKLGIQPDTQAATALVAAAAQSNNMTIAQNVFDELFGECPRQFAVWYILGTLHSKLAPVSRVALSSLAQCSP